MRSGGKPGRGRAHLVTEARPSRSADIRQRERRYLLIMGIRLACFIAAGILFLSHAGWLAVIPAAASIALPYFAVVIANSRRSVGPGDFTAYQPRLPDRYSPQPAPPAAGGSGGGTAEQPPDAAGDGTAGTAGN